MTKRAVEGTKPGGAYSPGIVAEGRFVYVSGQAPIRDGVVTGESAGEQTRAVSVEIDCVEIDCVAVLPG